MFDIAYLPEATVEAARIESSKLWEKILETNFQIPLSGFFECMQMARYGEIITYWNFIYYTHGGF